MASMLALRTRPVSKLVERLLFPSARSISSSSTRSFTNAAQIQEVDDEVGHTDRHAITRRPTNDPFPSLFSDVFDPFYPQRTLSQVLNMVDQMMDSPLATSARGMGGGLRRAWDAKEDADGLYLRIDMPGLGKEDVKVTVEQDTLVIKGEDCDKDAKGKDDPRGRYNTRIDLPAKVYKSNEIRAEMKNGVLKVFVPKVKAEERKGVLQINVE